ncbi:hypothetical protein FM111_00965 [Brevundimonas diminuta 3F5N]|uniref:Uncharacterized protein n=1 Tax=Brevundimonas diminuta 3F5N TaxID=1255603 RepID=A0A1R4EV25_BREDI|nr:hypothetical protein FM111_00965 [Brevundimonas diminuta 3F5N]
MLKPTRGIGGRTRHASMNHHVQQAAGIAAFMVTEYAAFRDNG